MCFTKHKDKTKAVLVLVVSPPPPDPFAESSLLPRRPVSHEDHNGGHENRKQILILLPLTS